MKEMVSSCGTKETSNLRKAREEVGQAVVVVALAAVQVAVVVQAVLPLSLIHI